MWYLSCVVSICLCYLCALTPRFFSSWVLGFFFICSPPASRWLTDVCGLACSRNANLASKSWLGSGGKKTPAGNWVPVIENEQLSSLGPGLLLQICYRVALAYFFIKGIKYLRLYSVGKLPLKHRNYVFIFFSSGFVFYVSFFFFSASLNSSEISVGLRSWLAKKHMVCLIWSVLFADSKTILSQPN